MSELYSIVIKIENGQVIDVYENGGGPRYPYVVMSLDTDDCRDDEIFKEDRIEFCTYGGDVIQDKELVDRMLKLNGMI